MEKYGIVLFVSALVFAASYASAEGLYVRGIAGATFPTDTTISGDTLDSYEIEYDTGWLLGAAVGNVLNNNVRVEGEFAYSKSDVDKWDGQVVVDIDMEVWSFLVNCYYDIQTDSPVTPFIGGGIGVANVDLNVQGDSADATVFAYQASAGIGYAVNDSVTIELGYRYMGTSAPEYENNIEGEHGSHNVYGGVRVAIQ